MKRAEDVRHPGIVAAHLALELPQCLQHIAATLAGHARIGPVAHAEDAVAGDALSGDNGRLGWPGGNATGFTPFELGVGATDGSGALHSAISPPQLGSFEEVAATIQRDPAACSQLKPSMLESFGNVDYPGLY